MLTFSVRFKNEHHIFKYKKYQEIVSITWNVFKEEDDDETLLYKFDFPALTEEKDLKFKGQTQDGEFLFEIPNSFTLKVLQVPENLQSKFKLPLSAVVWHK